MCTCGRLFCATMKSLIKISMEKAAIPSQLVFCNVISQKEWHNWMFYMVYNINVLPRNSYVLLWNTCNVKASSIRYSFWPIFNWVKDNVISPAYLTDLMIVIWRKSQEILVRKSPQIIQAMKCCTAQMTCLSKKQGLGITCSSAQPSLIHHWIFLIWGTDNQNVLFTFLYMSLLPGKCPYLGANRFSDRHKNGLCVCLTKGVLMFILALTTSTIRHIRNYSSIALQIYWLLIHISQYRYANHAMHVHKLRSAMEEFLLTLVRFHRKLTVKGLWGL